jgi:hypothetical protein
METLIQKTTDAAIKAYYDPREKAARAVTYVEPTPSGAGAGAHKVPPLLPLEWNP